jgi:hypothetical protein
MRSTDPVPGPSFIGYYVDPQRQVILSGRVASDPLRGPAGIDFPLAVDRLVFPAGEVETPNGLVQVRIPGFVTTSTQGELEFECGDVLILRGALTAPEHDKDYDYAEYLTRHGVYALLERPQVLGKSAPPAFKPRAALRLRFCGRFSLGCFCGPMSTVRSTSPPTASGCGCAAKGDDAGTTPASFAWLLAREVQGNRFSSVRWTYYN